MYKTVKNNLDLNSNAIMLPKVRIPIRVKIVIPYLLLSIFLAMGAAYVITQIVFDSLEERFTNQLIESGKLSSEWMVREEERLIKTMRLVSNSTGVSEAIQARQVEKLRDLTFGIVISNQEEAVEILDEQGYLLLSMRHRRGGKIEEYQFVKEGDQSFLQSDFVKQVVEGQTDSFSDKQAGLVLGAEVDYLYIAGPILNLSGIQVGTVLVGRSLETISQKIREESLSQVNLYGFNGEVYQSTFSQPITIDEDQVKKILANQDEKSLTRNFRDIQISNIDYQEILGPWEIRDNKDIGVIGIALPKTFLVSPKRVTRLQITLLVGAALFLVIVMGVNLARVITQPLIRLARASTQVSLGDFQVQLETRSNDEVAVLTEAFNQMVKSVQTSREALLHAYNSTLEGWSKALELRDKETEGHTLRVTQRTVELAQSLGIEGEALVHIQRGALLHDIGKLGVPDQILLKPGKLTDDEWVIMRQHPQYAYDMIWPIEYLRPALDIPYYHHERWEGTGYPKKLKGEEIPIAARIFSIIDVWDALTNERPYKRAMSDKEALAEIKSQRGIQFDPLVVDAFLEYIAKKDDGAGYG
jgi:HD-GYP domain-containing protein (c-di-GMP phosphodiesterase class II)